MSSESAKRELRKKMNQIRGQVDSMAATRAGGLMAEAFRALPEFDELRCVALYASTTGEPDTRPHHSAV